MTGKVNFPIVAIISLLSFPSVGVPIDSARRKAPRIPFSSFRRVAKKNTDYAVSSNRNHAYLSFVFESGLSTMRVTPTTLHVGFPYSDNATGQTQVFEDSVVLSGKFYPTQAYSFGLEFGKDNSRFFGMNIFIYDSRFPYSKFGHNLSFEFKGGYNILLSERFRLRPTALLDLNYLNVLYGRQIDNRDRDLNIFGKVFPYKSTSSTGHGSSTVYSKSTTVSFREMTVLAKVRLELSYRISPGVILLANAGYCWNLSRSEAVKISNTKVKQVLSLNTQSLDFSSSVPANKIFSYNGMFWNVGVAFYFGH